MSLRRQRLLMQRRERLLIRSAVLREHFGGHAQGLKPAARWVDRVRDGVEWLKQNPIWPLASVALFVIARPAVLARWGLRAFGAWRLWRRLRPLSGPVLRGLGGLSDLRRR